MDAAAACAYRIIQAGPKTALASVAQLPDSAVLLQRIEDLSRQVAALSSRAGSPSLQLHGPSFQLQEPSPGQ